MENLNIKILVAEDDQFMQFIYQTFFNKLGVKQFDIIDNAEHILTRPLEQYDLVISDYELKGNMSGLAFLKWVKQKAPHLPFIMISSLGHDCELINQCKLYRANKVMAKPLYLNTLAEVIHNAVIH